MARRAAIAAACLAFVVGVNAYVVFSEGWAFDGFPHGYLYTALQVHQDRDVYDGADDAYWGPLLDNWDYSPVYRIASVFASIGEPTPPWFRLAGCALLAAIFVVSCWLPVGAQPVDRLLTALVVSTTPVLMFATRYVDDHALHVLILLVAAALLVRSRNGRRLAIVWPVYGLFALGLLFTHMVTNFLIAAFCLACMIAWTLAVRVREDGAGALARELPRVLVAFVLVAAVAALRYTSADFTAFLDYYRGQSGQTLGAGSWIARALAYPRLLVFGQAGLAVSLVAALNLVPRLRGKDAGLYAAWLVVPLVALSVLGKKNGDYVWYLVPAVALLAAGVLHRAPAWGKWLAVGVCLVFAGLHAVGHASPLVGLVDRAAFQSAELTKESRLVVDEGETIAEAWNVIAATRACKSGAHPALLLFGVPPSQSVQVPLQFAVSMLAPECAFWAIDAEHADFRRGVVAVELLDEKYRRGDVVTPWQQHTLDALHAALVVARQTPTLRVWCHPDDVVDTPIIERPHVQRNE